jgi:hypothetical protein
MHGDQARQGRVLARPGRRIWPAGVLAAGLAALLAGCGSSAAAPVALPKKPAHVMDAGAKPAPVTPKQKVIAAYQGYWRATNVAVDSRSPARARIILASYIPSEALPGLVKGLQALWKADEVSYGSPVLHIMSVKITGPGTAAVHDCVDMSHSGLVNKKTGQIVGELGQSHQNLITKLVRQHGKWLVAGEIPVVQSCSY